MHHFDLLVLWSCGAWLCFEF